MLFERPDHARVPSSTASTASIAPLASGASMTSLASGASRGSAVDEVGWGVCCHGSHPAS